VGFVFSGCLCFDFQGLEFGVGGVGLRVRGLGYDRLADAGDVRASLLVSGFVLLGFELRFPVFGVSVFGFRFLFFDRVFFCSSGFVFQFSIFRLRFSVLEFTSSSSSWLKYPAESRFEPRIRSAIFCLKA